VIRTLFAAHANQILERLVFLAPGQEKQFSVTCALPEKLPPTFKGTGVRYLYEVQVGVKYRQAACGEREALRKSFENQNPHSMTIRKQFCVSPSYLDATQMNNKAAEDGQMEEVPMLEVSFQPDDEVQLHWSEISDDDKTSSTDGSILSKVVSESAESSSTAMALRSGMSGSMTEAPSVSRFSLAETEISYAQPIRRRNSSLTHAEANADGDVHPSSDVQSQIRQRDGCAVFVQSLHDLSLTSRQHPGWRSASVRDGQERLPTEMEMYVVHSDAGN